MSDLPILNIATNDLKTAINTASLTLGNGPDITSHFLFEMVDNELFVSACNPPRIYSSIPLKGIRSTTPKPKKRKRVRNRVKSLTRMTLTTTPLSP